MAIGVPLVVRLVLRPIEGRVINNIVRRSVVAGGWGWCARWASGSPSVNQKTCGDQEPVKQ